MKRCNYGQHKWNITKEEIKCRICGEVVEKPTKDHGNNPLDYTKDQYDF